MENKNNSTYYKLKKFIEHEIKYKNNIKILEFGVQKGYSTDFFLNICKKKQWRTFVYRCKPNYI